MNPNILLVNAFLFDAFIYIVLSLGILGVSSPLGVENFVQMNTNSVDKHTSEKLEENMPQLADKKAPTDVVVIVVLDAAVLFVT